MIALLSALFLTAQPTVTPDIQPTGSPAVSTGTWSMTFPQTDGVGQLSSEDAQMVAQLLDILHEQNKWQEGSTELTADVEITTDDGETYVYESETGELNSADQHTTLDYEAKVGLNEVLGQYGILEDSRIHPITGETALSPEELAYFNETYFNNWTAEAFIRFCLTCQGE